MNNVVSVKDRLKNISVKSGKTLQELFTLYGLERTIYRISVSEYVRNFTLKGGIFLYASFDGNYSRMTTDIDFLAERISNDINDMKNIFLDIFSIETVDPLRYDLTSLAVTPITEFKTYHGVNISILAYLDRTRIPISIDIGFDDVVVPEKSEMDFPVLLNDKTPRIFVYSLASSIAEKFEAIVSLAYDNSRFKDFYDIYMLATSRNFNSDDLTAAVQETFAHRNTSLKEIVAFEEGFVMDPIRQSRWNAFVRKKKTMIPVTLEEAVNMIRKLLLPIVDAINTGEEMHSHWHCDTAEWMPEE